MPRKIIDIDVDEITLCASTANRKMFFIKKSKEKAMDKFIELIKGFVVDEDDDELTKEEIAKAEALGKEPTAVIENALNTFQEYKDSMPDDLLAATKILVKQATFVDFPVKKEELEKAGAALSKSTKAQLTKVLEFLKGSPQAIAALQAMLGLKVEKLEGVVDDDGEKLSTETEAKLEKLKVLEKAETERIEKEAEKKKEKEDKAAQEIKDRLEALETGKPVKKSIDNKGDDDDDDKKKNKKDLKKDEEVEDLYPSMYVPGLAE
jgi:hypothetical protein